MSARKQVKSSAKFNLSSLKPAKGSRQKRKRLGKGESSGLGKTSGKGHKGARARSGYSRKAGFEGGQMPIHRRLPKRGFTSRKRTLGVNKFVVLSLDVVQNRGLSGEVTLEQLITLGLVHQGEKVKILLGLKPFTGKLNIQAHAVSQSARQAIESTGGQVSLVTA